MKFFNNTKREYLLIGVLIGVVLALAAYAVPQLVG
jgi:hypothetical protein